MGTMSLRHPVNHTCVPVCKSRKKIVPLYKAVSYELSQRFFDFF